MKFRIALFALVLLAAPIGTIWAGTIAISVTGGTIDSFGTASVVGYTFQTNSAISITELGGYSVDGFSESPSVGIWDSEGDLVASASLAPTALTDQFVYQSISPVALESGQIYTIGELLPAPPSFDVLLFPTGLSTAPEITFIAGVYTSEPTLVEPGTNAGTSIGPNFQFTLSVSESSVPEPYSFVPLGSALLCLTLALRRRTRFRSHAEAT